jgi:hypothetical protein
MILRAWILVALAAVVLCDEPDSVSVVEGIPVPAVPIAEERSDDFGAADQLAEESQSIPTFQIAQDRDGTGGHHHAGGHHGGGHAAGGHPAGGHGGGGHAAGGHGNNGGAAAAGDQYSAPQASPAGYSSPQAAPSNNYNAPQAAPAEVDEYGAPQAAPVSNYQPAAPSRPIPVPLPVNVRPGSIVIPAGPKPQYRPPPPQRPQKKPQYKPQPPPRKPQPPPQKYRPKPPPQYKPRPPPVQYKPKPKPVQRPPPVYKPKPQPKPAYKQPVQAPPPKQTYSPAPARPAPVAAPTYVKPVKPVEEAWPSAQPDMPKITSLDVQCEKNLMKVSVKFDKPFYGIIFSKGFYSDVNCVHLPAGVGRSDAQFDIAINSCGTTGNTENGLYGYGADSGSGTYFENTIVVQYDPQVQEVWDQARKLRCTWHDQYEKSVTFRPFPVDMLDVVRADFAGDNVGCWMQIQVGKGPWASEVSGLVKIGQTMTMVLAIKDDEQKFDMLVRNCMAHDGKRAPIQLVDQKGCVTRPKLMSKFTKIKNFGASASVLSYAHFQAFKFPDSMEVHFQCTIQICRYQCPEQCVGTEPAVIPAAQPSNEAYGAPKAPAKSTYGAPQSRTKRDLVRRDTDEDGEDDTGDIGVEKVIHVVSSGDLTFDIKEGNDTVLDVYPSVAQSLHEEQGYICMSTPAFSATLIILLGILVISCFLSAFLCLRHRSYYGDTSLIAAFTNPVFAHKKGHF